eukprot:PhF_6_TR35108/c0_g1_i1/m.51179/K00472/P4HA; prolyl 4-hydroxylase
MGLYSKIVFCVVLCSVAVVKYSFILQNKTTRNSSVALPSQPHDERTFYPASKIHQPKTTKKNRVVNSSHKPTRRNHNHRKNKHSNNKGPKPVTFVPWTNPPEETESPNSTRDINAYMTCDLKNAQVHIDPPELIQGVFANCSMNATNTTINNTCSGHFSDLNVSWEIVSFRPRIVYISNFLSKEQCDNASQHLEEYYEGHRSEFTQPGSRFAKTDGGSYHHFNVSGVCGDIGLDIRYCEKYREVARRITGTVNSTWTKVYGPFFRRFDNVTHPRLTHVDNADACCSIITMLPWLYTTEEGGETAFMKAIPQEISFKPKCGDAIAWFNLSPEGYIDPVSCHEGRRVVKGKKWTAFTGVFPLDEYMKIRQP